MGQYHFKLLTRDQFREQVFARDRHTCVFCTSTEVVAHHIIERRLWEDGGYYVENGASVCDAHHLQCESTELSVEDVRLAAGITRILVPPHLYPDQVYDKWGNPVLPNGRRLRGELVADASVQKILAQNPIGVEFTSWVKYPRTYHLPWSMGVNSDDRVMTDLSAFEGQRVIVTEKMDGENTSLYSDYIHARSIDGRSHPSRDWVKQFWSQIAGDIPSGWRVCGENLWAKHSIGYKTLASYFQGFSIWDETNTMLGWDQTREWFNLLGVTPVRVLYDGPFNRKLIEALWTPDHWEHVEGYVLRLAEPIHYGAFRNKVGKFVRSGHVQTAKHWMYGQVIERNILKIKD